MSADALRQIVDDLDRTGGLSKASFPAPNADQPAVPRSYRYPARAGDVGPQESASGSGADKMSRDYARPAGQLGHVTDADALGALLSGIGENLKSLYRGMNTLRRDMLSVTAAIASKTHPVLAERLLDQLALLKGEEEEDEEEEEEVEISIVQNEDEEEEEETEGKGKKRAKGKRANKSGLGALLRGDAMLSTDVRGMLAHITSSGRSGGMAAPPSFGVIKGRDTLGEIGEAIEQAVDAGTLSATDALSAKTALMKVSGAQAGQLSKAELRISLERVPPAVARFFDRLAA